MFLLNHCAVKTYIDCVGCRRSCNVWIARGWGAITPGDNCSSTKTVAVSV